MGHTLSGSDDSPVRIEVFSDLQCPACRELFFRIIQPTIKEYGDQVNVVYHEFPLTGHQFARPAARYVAATSRLGQKEALLSVYDAIFSDRDRWAVDGSLEYSVSTALPREDFLTVRQMLQDQDTVAGINANIEREVMFGMSKGVASTPTMFISSGGKEEKVEGVMENYQFMKRFIDSVVK